ncbi:PKD domain-containing protein [Spongiimicrobium salis]|uniref:PKD domain-containing protein n=1 Tax=Spongiimicrobium salis TaxID=1667022 RepID=UPI00374CC0ED
MNTTVDCSAIDFEIISTSFTTEDLIEFKSTDPAAVDWTWDFGDRSTPVFRSNVVHRYKNPGTYTVTLESNGKCVASKEVVVSKRRMLISPELIPEIILPKNVRVGDEVVFSNNSSFAKSWQWSFGETLAIDGRDREEKYTFKTPGEKTILLVVNGDLRHEAKQRITVLPAKKKKKKRVIKNKVDPIETVLKDIDDKPEEPVIPDAPVEEEPERIVVSSDEIRQLLLDYSKRKVDDLSIRNYFCYSNIPVFNKKGTRFTVSQLFGQIRDVRVEVKNLRLIKDSKTGCIKSMTIDMRTKKGVFWKSF